MVDLDQGGALARRGRGDMKRWAKGGLPGKGILLLVNLCLLITLGGCARPVPAILNLYDMSGYNLMQCSTLPHNQSMGTQGPLHCSSVDGEQFSGQWMTMWMHKTPDMISSDYLTAIPYVTGNALVTRWGWANSFGVDLEGVTGIYGIFLLYGNRGTVIDGVFTFRSDAYGVLGAAVDNRGHRYKVMG